MKRNALVVLACLCLGAASAAAFECPSVPDDQSTRNIENGQQRATCLANQLNERSQRVELEQQLTQFGTTLHRLELQRRFDTMPRFSPP